MTECLPIAAIVHSGKHMADKILTTFIDELIARDWHVLGLVPGPMAEPGNGAMRTLRNVGNGDIYPIGQNLGRGSAACSLDSGALIATAFVLQQACDAHPDLIVVNRYGALEADGKGFAQEMLSIMTQGIPMLTVVSELHLDAWRHFTGGLALSLTPDHRSLYEWTRQLPAARRLPLAKSPE